LRRITRAPEAARKKRKNSVSVYAICKNRRGEIMKKKVALLLALVMVLAMVPMSAFGATARAGSLLNPRVNPGTQEFVVRIDAAAFSGLSESVVRNAVLDIQFSNPDARGFTGWAAADIPADAAANDWRRLPLAVTFAAGPDFAVSSPAAVDVQDAIDIMDALTLTRVSNSRLLVDLFTGGWVDGTWVLDGFVDLRIASINANPGETIAVYLRTGGDGVEVRNIQLLAPTPLAGQWNNGVTITAGAPTNIGMFAVLPSIRITENNVGRLVPVGGGASSFMVRLVAPRGFRWSTTLAYTTRQGPALSVSARSGGISSVPTIARHTAPGTGAEAGYHFNEITQRSELYLNIGNLTRGTGFINETTFQWVEISGLALIPVEGAATAGTVGIDVYVGQNVGTAGQSWGSGVFAMPDNPAIDAARPADSPNRNDDPARTDNRTRVLGSFWAEYNNNDGNQHWRTRNLPVVNLERIVGNLTVAGPAAIETVNSGSWHLGTTWLNGGYHTIQIIENSPGVLFSNLDQFELRPSNPGVRIIDFQTRVRRGTSDNIGGNWGELALAIPVLTNYVDGSLTFAPMHDRAGWNPVAHRVEVRLALSVEAGYQARFGEAIYVEVLQNGARIGEVHIANARDLIEVVQGDPVVMYRDAFDVIGPEVASTFTVRERVYGTLAAQSELHFSLQSFRDGNPINLGQWNLIPHVGIPTTNEVASGMLLAPPATGGTGLDTVTVLRQSVGTPGAIMFNDVMVSGPVVPNVDWHVLVFGPQIAPNSSLWVYRNGLPTGALTGTAIEALSLRQQRGVFYYLPYHATILSVIGESDVTLIGDPGQAPGPDPQPPTPQPPAPARIYWTHTMPWRNDAPVLYVYGGATLIQTRAFSDQFAESDGMTITNLGGGNVRVTGVNRISGLNVEILMSVGSSNITLNGVSQDIATFVNQPTLAGQIVPVNRHGRIYVPGRLVANALGIPFGSAPGGIRFND
jgi:hypothetical protein